MGLHNCGPDRYLSTMSARHYRFNQCEFKKSPLTLNVDTYQNYQMNLKRNEPQASKTFRRA
jgi:hypothetical protein